MRGLTNSIKKNLKSFKYAFQGIKFLVKEENNFRYHLLAAVVAITLGFYLQVTTTEWLIIITMIGLVLMAEAFNTSLEKLIDILHPELHPKVGKAKDIAAGAVLIIAIAAAIVGITIFAGKLY
ncbi:diacylglycerol kinase family protein [Fulvivirga kasyanovii]|uniref:Diacylglycerol kinase family protein n=1 Tax=Fulvivirga kasyanovii TaxID=396812 RepID=A0ABW9RRE5_9BACT|nr:diacylglycerol kinase family protein [Fulvivirga kasyanovii]MTI26769.1 diacylglycerol kinase family protein [Fulvivirga kasyanovii]